MNFHRMIRLLAGIVFIGSLILVAFSSQPAKNRTTVLQVNLANFGLTSKTDSNFSSEQNSLGEIEMVVGWPERILVGKKGTITLNLMADLNQMGAAANESGSSVNDEKSATHSSILDENNLVGEARLELFGPDLSPQGTVSENILPGETARFEWSVLPHEEGPLKGMLWVYLNRVPKAGGETDRVPILARQVVFRADNLFGMQPRTVQWIGWVGIILSASLMIWNLNRRLRNSE